MVDRRSALRHGGASRRGGQDRLGAGAHRDPVLGDLRLRPAGASPLRRDADRRFVRAMDMVSPRADPLLHPASLPLSADVVVIGGGIIGASTALTLAERGISVALCEKGH